MSQQQIIIAFIGWGIFFVAKYICDIKSINNFKNEGSRELRQRFNLSHRKSILESKLLRRR